MQLTAQKCLFFILAGLLGSVALSFEAAAAKCEDVYPGAQVGPPPEWTFWADGSACFVRWAAESPADEDKLQEQCRNTSGARFVHFEADKISGRGICIFKLLEPQMAQASASAPASAKEDAYQVAPEQSAPQVDKRSPEEVLEELEALVRARNEECLAKERSEDPLGAGSCWKAAAQAVEEFTRANSLPGKDLKRKLAELQATWIKRAAQLEGAVVEPKIDTVQIVPSSVEDDQNSGGAQARQEEETSLPSPSPAKHEGRDPNRLSATSACSSATLGSRKSCFSTAMSKGRNLYEFRLKPGCSAGSIAALGITDAKGRCVRKVVSISKGEEQLVESHAEPAVVDAIEYQSDYVQCYSRRHENISCDGKVDYGDQKSAGKASQQTKTAVKKRATKKKQASRKRASTKVKVAAAPQQKKSVKLRKSKRKKETALQVTTNYTRKPEVRDNAKKLTYTKPAYTEEQKKPTVSCLLFSKLC